MMNEQTAVLVMKDGMGNYFLVPQQTLEQGRVPEERRAEVERLIGEQHEDVQGYVWQLLAGAALLLAGELIGYGVSTGDTRSIPRAEREIHGKI